MGIGKAGGMLLVCVLTASLLAAGPEDLEASEACSAEPGEARLIRFEGQTPTRRVASHFYLGDEGASARATIGMFPGDCQPGGVRTRVDYETRDGTAVAPADYTSTSGRTPEICDDLHYPDYCGPASPPPQSVEVAVPVAADGLAEAAVESFEFRLTGGNKGLGVPASAPVHVVDVDGPSRFSLEPRLDGTGPVEYSILESFPHVSVPIFRAGPAGGTAEIGFELEPAPDAEHPATPGEDFTLPSGAPNPIVFAAGQRIAWLRINIVNDTEVEPDETFEVRLLGDQIAEPSSTTFTIVDNDSDDIPPRTRFHHPRQGVRYGPNDYRLREMHTFFSDRGGSQVVRVQMALRRKMADGRCAWWRGGKFRAGGCGKRVWLNMEFDGLQLYLKRFPRLKPTQGTRVQHYKAWTRGIDGAGNVERNFVKGRNANMFWVKKPR